MQPSSGISLLAYGTDNFETSDELRINAMNYLLHNTFPKSLVLLSSDITLYSTCIYPEESCFPNFTLSYLSFKLVAGIWSSWSSSETIETYLIQEDPSRIPSAFRITGHERPFARPVCRPNLTNSRKIMTYIQSHQQHSALRDTKS